MMRLIILISFFGASCGLLLLSDLPTPAFLINVEFLQQQHGRDNPISPIFLPRSEKTLVPVEMEGVTCPHILDSQLAYKDNDDTTINSDGTCFWHSSVVRSRGDDDSDSETTTTTATASSSTFLAELDIPAKEPAQLVLGLNNHHVGSYYWARSAGSGAAMEAPGVQLGSGNNDNDNNNDDSCLYWASEEGPTACNSNDGKRSEWVNFLRPHDQVQLIPEQAEKSILRWIEQHAHSRTADSESSSSSASASAFSLGRIFGVSNYKRPLGSEPAVVCEWKLVEGQ